MKPEIVNLLVMIGTLVSAISAAIAAIATSMLVGGWRNQATYEGKRSAVIAWMSGAALFQGTLKQVYLDKVEWPKDKEAIELVSKSFFSLVSLWPAVQASLSGNPKHNAEVLWSTVFQKYNGYMDGSGNRDALSDAIAAIYNSEHMQKLASVAR